MPHTIQSPTWPNFTKTRLTLILICEIRIGLTKFHMVWYCRPTFLTYAIGYLYAKVGPMVLESSMNIGLFVICIMPLCHQDSTLLCLTMLMAHPPS